MLESQRLPEKAPEKLVQWAISSAQQQFPGRFAVSSTSETTRLAKFEAISLYMALALWHMQHGGARYTKLAQAAHDHLFDLFDIALREQGVGDIGVGKRVKKMAAAFQGRVHSYSQAFDQADAKSLQDKLQNNQVCDAAEAQLIAQNAMHQAKSLQQTPTEQWLIKEVMPIT